MLLACPQLSPISLDLTDIANAKWNNKIITRQARKVYSSVYNQFHVKSRLSLFLSHVTVFIYHMCCENYCSYSL